MKRTTAMAVLGLVVTTATTALGQGAILIGNYQPPYNPVVWTPGNPVKRTDGVNLTIWYGEGTLSDPSQLTGQGPTFGLSSLYEGNGYAGYYDWTLVLIPAGDGQGLWAPGETWTFAVSVSGAAGGWSHLYTSSAMTDQGLAVPPPPGRLMQSIGLVLLPEPSIFALTGLGGGMLVLLRRKRS